VQVFAPDIRYAPVVKPDQLSKLGVTVPEIINALQAQNTVNPAGKAGGEPAPKGKEFTHTVLAQGRLVSPEEFGRSWYAKHPTAEWYACAMWPD